MEPTQFPAAVFVASDAGPCAMGCLEPWGDHPFSKVKPHIKEKFPRENKFHSLIFKRGMTGHKLKMAPLMLRGKRNAMILKNPARRDGLPYRSKFERFDHLPFVTIEKTSSSGVSIGEQVLHAVGRAVYPDGHDLQNYFDDNIAYTGHPTSEEWVNVKEFAVGEIKKELSSSSDNQGSTIFGVYPTATQYNPEYDEPQVVMPMEIVSFTIDSYPPGLHQTFQAGYTYTGLPWKSVIVLTAKQVSFAPARFAGHVPNCVRLQVLEDASLLTEDSDFDFDALLIVPRFYTW